MKNVLRYFAQALLYVPFMVIVGYFSTSPAYHHLAPDQALIRFSFSHAAQRKVECHERTPEELAKLAPNMRAPMDCPRERAPVTVELELDGQMMLAIVAPPSGLARDGSSTVYRRLPVAAGAHRIVARLKDRVGGDFNYVRDVELEIKPGRVLVIDFNPREGGFVFKL